MNRSPHSPGFHAYALFVAAATFPLIFIGGLVTSHGAGMSVPDWPNSYGYNMFLFPPAKWVGNIWYEHVHRLYASFIGLLAIVLCAWAWLGGLRRPVRQLSACVLGMVVFQGVLGGLRVVLVQLNLAIVHACVAQVFLCLTVLVALVTSRAWADAPDLTQSKELPAGRKVLRTAFIAVAAVYGQLMIGAVTRHYQAGLAIPDFPLSYGKLLPPTSGAQWQIVAHKVYHFDDADLYGPPAFSLGQVWLAFAHRAGALLVSVTLLTLVYKVLRLHRGRPGLIGPALLLIALLLAQLTLGALTVLLRKPADVASAHVAVGALVLATSFVLAARAVRLYRPRPVEAAPRRGFEVLSPVRVAAGPNHAIRATS